MAKLTFMVGGVEEEYNAAQELLTCMGANVVYCGQVGTGQVQACRLHPPCFLNHIFTHTHCLNELNHMCTDYTHIQDVGDLCGDLIHDDKIVWIIIFLGSKLILKAT